MSARAHLPEPAFISIRQAAALTGMSETMIRRAVHEGSLKASNFGKLAYRIKRDDVFAWADKTAVQPATPPTATKPRRAADTYTGPKRLTW